MKHIRSLYRSPLKTAITLLLLSAAAFLFLYNLSEYSVSDREYREARDRYGMYTRTRNGWWIRMGEMKQR